MWKNNNYLPDSFHDIMENFRAWINNEFKTNYTPENFVGTNFYKYFYGMAQILEENEQNTALIFEKLRDYITSTNEKMNNANFTDNGIIDGIKKLGFQSCIQKITADNVGVISIAVDIDSSADDYLINKLNICKFLAENLVAGVITDGTETWNIPLDNGQMIEVGYFLPDILHFTLRLSLRLSERQEFMNDYEDIKARLRENIKNRYQIGFNFEPQRYFSIEDDLISASEAILEWKITTAFHTTYTTDIYEANFDDKIVIDAINIELIEEE